jgi:hypothetical protein
MGCVRTTSSIDAPQKDPSSMKTSVRAFLLALLISAPAIAEQAAEQAAETIGRIHDIQGVASVERGGTVLPLAAGTALHRGDRVRTGKPGAVGIVLTDDTTISLGSGSELSLADYQFAPREGKFSLVVRMIKGTFSYVTGQIVKLAPETAQVRTPDATIAVRGTKLLIEIEE